jgi:uncharacterized protein (DUF362 family)
MNYFVDFQSVFSNDSERTIEKLSALYTRREYLKNIIAELLSKRLQPEKVKGRKVLLKPNWVVHSRIDTDEICVRTHNNFTLAALETVLTYGPESVLIGDAPIQSCNWARVVTPQFLEEVMALSQQYKVPVMVKDFRRKTFDPSRNNPVSDLNPITEYTLFDVGVKSYLEPITSTERSLFRVSNYDPDRMVLSHGPGMHKYCISDSVFDSDMVISMPKVKTHQKIGITAAIKNLVGLNGDKDFLPHYRLGGTGFGGDSYPGKNYLRYWSELASDFADRRQGKFLYWPGYYASNLLMKLSSIGRKNVQGAWKGNDTTWRMVLDLNKIAIYGKKDGTLAEAPQRVIYSLCDGIIGGQGDGPLNPFPLALGVISFANHSGLNDKAVATLMGFDTEKLPMLHEAAQIGVGNAAQLTWNGQDIQEQDLAQHIINTLPPPAWGDALRQILAE